MKHMTPPIVALSPHIYKYHIVITNIKQITKIQIEWHVRSIAQVSVWGLIISTFFTQRHQPGKSLCFAVAGVNESTSVISTLAFHGFTVGQRVGQRDTPLDTDTVALVVFTTCDHIFILFTLTLTPCEWSCIKSQRQVSPAGTVQTNVHPPPSWCGRQRSGTHTLWPLVYFLLSRGTGVRPLSAILRELGFE